MTRTTSMSSTGTCPGEPFASLASTSLGKMHATQPAVKHSIGAFRFCLSGLFISIPLPPPRPVLLHLESSRIVAEYNSLYASTATIQIYCPYFHFVLYTRIEAEMQWWSPTCQVFT